jgi:hypothetical protein
MRGSTNVMPLIFFLRNCNCNNNKIYMDDSYIFAIMRLVWYEVLPVVTMKTAVFWVVMSCRLVWVSQHFRGLYGLHHQSNDDGGSPDLWNVGKLIPVYMVLQPGREPSPIMRLFFHKVSNIFNTVLPTLSKTLYINVVKFPASTLGHITETFFQFTVTCKMASTQCSLYRSKQVVVGGC